METQFRTYIFHHNQIEFSEEFRHFKNLKSGVTARIELKESEVFIRLLENANRLCTKNQLLDCWSPSVVSESALTRVISLLRGHLKDVGAEHIIKTDMKRGYILETKVSYSPQLKIKKAIPKIKNQLLTPGKILLFATILAALMWMIAAVSYKPATKIPTQYEASRQFMSPVPNNNTQYRNPSISPQGDLLVYSTTKTDIEHWHLEWLDLVTMQKNRHGIADMNLAKPVWRDEQSFAYHAYNDSLCEIRLALLNSGSIVKDSLIYRCSEQTQSKSIAWKDKQHLFFTDSNAVTQPHELWEVNIENLSRKHIKSENEFGRGIYGVHVNQAGDKVALMLGDHWGKTTVETYNMDNLDSPTLQFEVNRQLFSLGWLADDNIVYQNAVGGISVHHTQLNTSTDLSFPPEDYFSNPVVGGKNQLALINGGYFSLALFDISTTSPLNINNASIGNYPGDSIKTLTVDNDSTYFVSDATGVNQIYRSTSGEEFLVSNFQEHMLISQLLVSESMGIAVVAQHDEVTIFEFNQEKIHNELFSSQKANSACLYDEQLLLVLVNDGIPDIYSIDLKTFASIRRMTSTGAQHCKVSDGKLFYTRHNADGIWQFTPDSEDLQIIDHPISADYDAWLFDNETLWFISPSNALYTAILQKESKPRLIKENVLSIYPGTNAVKALGFAMLPNQIQVLKISAQRLGSHH